MVVIHLIPEKVKQSVPECNAANFVSLQQPYDDVFGCICHPRPKDIFFRFFETFPIVTGSGVQKRSIVSRLRKPKKNGSLFYDFPSISLLVFESSLKMNVER